MGKWLLILMVAGFSALVCQADPTWQADQQELEAKYRELGSEPLALARFLHNDPAAEKFLKNNHTVPLGPLPWEQYPAADLARHFDYMIRGYMGETEKYFLQYEIFRERERDKLRAVDLAPAGPATVLAERLLRRVPEPSDSGYLRDRIPQYNIVYTLLHSRHPEVRALAEAKYFKLSAGIQETLDPDLWKQPLEKKMREEWTKIQEAPLARRAGLLKDFEARVRRNSYADHSVKMAGHHAQEIALFEKWSKDGLPPVPTKPLPPKLTNAFDALEQVLRQEEEHDENQVAKAFKQMTEATDAERAGAQIALKSEQERLAQTRALLKTIDKARFKEQPIDPITEKVAAHFQSSLLYPSLGTRGIPAIARQIPALITLASVPGNPLLRTRTTDALEGLRASAIESWMTPEAREAAARSLTAGASSVHPLAPELARAIRGSDEEMARKAMELFRKHSFWNHSTYALGVYDVEFLTEYAQSGLPQAAEAQPLAALLDKAKPDALWQALNDSALPSDHPFYRAVLHRFIRQGYPPALALMQQLAPPPAWMVAALVTAVDAPEPTSVPAPPDRFAGMKLSPETIWDFAKTSAMGTLPAARLTREIVFARLHSGQPIPQTWEPMLRQALEASPLGPDRSPADHLILDAIAHLAEISPQTRASLEKMLEKNPSEEVRQRTWEVLRDKSPSPRSHEERLRLAMSAYFVADPKIQVQAAELRKLRHISDEDRRDAIAELMNDPAHYKRVLRGPANNLLTALDALKGNPKLLERLAHDILLLEGNDARHLAALRAAAHFPVSSSFLGGAITDRAFADWWTNDDIREEAMRLFIHQPQLVEESELAALAAALQGTFGERVKAVAVDLAKAMAKAKTEAYQRIASGDLKLYQQRLDAARVLLATDPTGQDLQTLLGKLVAESRYQKLDEVDRLIASLPKISPQLEHTWLETGTYAPGRPAKVIALLTDPKRGPPSEGAQVQIGRALASRHPDDVAAARQAILTLNLSPTYVGVGFVPRPELLATWTQRLLDSKTPAEVAEVLRVARTAGLDRIHREQLLAETRKNPSAAFLLFALAPENEAEIRDALKNFSAQNVTERFDNLLPLLPQTSLYQEKLLAEAALSHGVSQKIWEAISKRRPLTEYAQKVAGHLAFDQGDTALGLEAKQFLLREKVNPWIVMFGALHSESNNPMVAVLRRTGIITRIQLLGWDLQKAGQDAVDPIGKVRQLTDLYRRLGLDRRPLLEEVLKIADGGRGLRTPLLCLLAALAPDDEEAMRRLDQLSRAELNYDFERAPFFNLIAQHERLPKHLESLLAQLALDRRDLRDGLWKILSDKARIEGEPSENLLRLAARMEPPKPVVVPPPPPPDFKTVAWRWAIASPFGHRADAALYYLRDQGPTSQAELINLLAWDTPSSLQIAAAHVIGERGEDSPVIRERLKVMEKAADPELAKAAGWSLRQLTKQERYENSHGVASACARRFRGLLDSIYARNRGLRTTAAR